LHRQIDHAAAFMKRIRPWEMTPDDRLVTAGDGYAMASKTQLAAYLPHGGAVTLNLSGMHGPLRAAWFDPRTGMSMSFGTFDATGSMEFRSPSQGEAEDWVLVLDKG
jgi:hypothetical protein